MTNDQEIYLRARSCDTKQKYYTEEKAKGDGYWDAYHCQFCKGFHRSTPIAQKALRAVRMVRKPVPKKKGHGTLPRAIVIRKIKDGIAADKARREAESLPKEPDKARTDKP